MNVTPEVLKDYVFGELDAAGRRAVEAAVAADASLREEDRKSTRLNSSHT